MIQPGIFISIYKNIYHKIKITVNGALSHLNQPFFIPTVKNLNNCITTAVNLPGMMNHVIIVNRTLLYRVNISRRMIISLTHILYVFAVIL